MAKQWRITALFDELLEIREVKYFMGINPIRALVFTAAFNGVAAVPLIYVIARINSSKKILDKNSGGILSRSLVWLTFAVMAIAAIAMFYTLARPH